MQVHVFTFWGAISYLWTQTMSWHILLYVLIFIYLDTVSFAVLYKTTVNYTDKISLSRTRLYVKIPRTFFSSYIKQQWTVLINFISDETESGNPEYNISRFHFNNCPEWTVGSFHIFFAFVLLLFQAYFCKAGFSHHHTG